jgi:hypothetical protein
MIRTVISLPANEKKWLDKMAKVKKVSMAQIIRDSIVEYHKNHIKEATTTIDTLLAKTKGIWRKNDGLKYQAGLRDEWEK